MDLRHYFRKIREIEAAISEEYPMIVSCETAEGGKAGRVSEVSRSIAAQLIVEGKAQLASPEEREAYLAAQEAFRQNAARAEMAKRLQVAILNHPDATSDTATRRK